MLLLARYARCAAITKIFSVPHVGKNVSATVYFLFRCNLQKDISRIILSRDFPKYCSGKQFKSSGQTTHPVSGQTKEMRCATTAFKCSG